jgi:hypothetical protein
MTTKKLLVIILIINSVFSHAQFDSIATKLNDHNRKFLNEQVYLHTDRDVYYLGDTIWYKAYVREKLHLGKSNLSNVLYVRLINEKGEEPVKQKLLIRDSEANGQICIDETVDKGIYYLVAYTSWMENFDIENAFSKKIFIKIEVATHYTLEPYYHKSIYFPGDTVRMRFSCFDNYRANIDDFNYKYSVVSNKKLVSGKTSGNQELEFVLSEVGNKIPKIKVNAMFKDKPIDTVIVLPFSNKIDVSFFPEGGWCINGLLNKIAFKAEFSNGTPANINGYVVNELGEKIVDVNAEHHGLGSFSFIPETNKKYFFEARINNDSSQRFELPVGINDGWQLKSTLQKNNKIAVIINNTIGDTTRALLSIKIRDCVVNFMEFQLLKQKQIIINTDSLPSGIGVITVFDGNLIPQAERLVFINHNATAKLIMEYNKPTFSARDSVNVKVKLTNKMGNPFTGTFSVSVFDNKLGTSNLLDEPNIVVSNYLASEIRGRIEHPNYYFSNDSLNVQHHLDLLLLTQGWRRYNYLSATDTLANPKPREYIEGQVMRFKFGRGLVPIEANVTTCNLISSSKIRTNDTGYFVFSPSYQPGTNPNYVLTSSDMKGDRKISLCIIPNSFDTKLTKNLETNINSLDRFDLKPINTYTTFTTNDSLKMKDNIWIDEVVVKRKKIEKNRDPLYSFVRSMATKKLNSYQMKTANDFSEILSAASLNVIYEIKDGEEKQYVYYMGDKVELGFYINGYPESYSIASFIAPKDFNELYVVKGPTAQNIYGSYVVVLLYTEKDDYYTNDPFPPNIFYVPSFTTAMEFYSPKYNSNIKNQQGINDLRRTLYWSPKIVFDQNGEATIKFFTCDRYSKMKCVIEGFTNNNEPLHGESYFEVVQ